MIKILDMEDLNRKDFKRINDNFDRFFGNQWPEVPLRRWEYCAAILYSGITEKLRLCIDPVYCLEAGCGQSVFAKYLANIGSIVHAIDIGKKNQFINGINYHDMSMTTIQFPTDQFDYVFAISSIEHVNAGRFAIPGMDFDTGDTQAMLEMVRILKPGGKLILTTDFADRYYPPPGLWPTGSHRIYDIDSMRERLLIPVYKKYSSITPISFALVRDYDWGNVLNVEPKKYAYTEVILTLTK